MGKNLIVNGDAETQLAGWSKSENFLFSRYGATAGEWDIGVVGAPGGGKNYFRLGIPAGKEKVTVTQIVDVTSETSLIDTGKVKFFLQGYFGGFVDSDSATLLTARFFDKDDKELDSASTEPVQKGELPPPSVGGASMIHRIKSGLIPKGTRKIRIELTGLKANFADCQNCDEISFADNLELLLSKGE